MSAYPEQRAALLQYACGVQGFPQRHGAHRLVEFLSGFLEVRYSRQVTAASYRARPDGGAVLTVPAVVDDRAEAVMLVEECGHAVCDVAGHVPWESYRDYREERLAVTRERGDESEARQFADAWWLPAPEVWRYLGREEPDWDGLLTDSDTDPEMVRRRVQRLQQPDAYRPWEPREWSAWSRYAVRIRRSGIYAAVCVTPRDGSHAPLEIPTTAAELEEQRWRIHGDLAALRPHELRLKHAVSASTWEDGSMPWTEFISRW